MVWQAPDTGHGPLLVLLGALCPGRPTRVPFGRKPKLTGPLWTVAGTADLTAAQHRNVDIVLGMCCEPLQRDVGVVEGPVPLAPHPPQARHGVKLADVYDKGRVCGDRGTPYTQFSEMRRSEQPPDDSGGDLLWSDLSVSIGRGVVDRFDKARDRVLRPVRPTQQRETYRGRLPAVQTPQPVAQHHHPRPDSGDGPPARRWVRTVEVARRRARHYQVRPPQRTPTGSGAGRGRQDRGDQGGPQSVAHRSAAGRPHARRGPARPRPARRMRSASIWGSPTGWRAPTGNCTPASSRTAATPQHASGNCPATTTATAAGRPLSVSPRAAAAGWTPSPKRTPASQ